MEESNSTQKNIKPSYYKDARDRDVIDAVFMWSLNFCRGTCLKYIVRAGKKDKTKEIEDLEKAREYLNREIERLKKEK